MRNLLKISGLLAATMLLGLMGAAAIKRAPDLLRAMWPKPAAGPIGMTTETKTVTSRVFTKEEAAQFDEDIRREYESDAPMLRGGMIANASMRDRKIEAAHRKVAIALSAKIYDRSPKRYFWSVLILDASKEIVWEHDCLENILIIDGVHPIRPSIAEEVSLSPGRYTVEYYLNALPPGVEGNSPPRQRPLRGAKAIEILDSDGDGPSVPEISAEDRPVVPEAPRP